MLRDVRTFLLAEVLTVTELLLDITGQWRCKDAAMWKLETALQKRLEPIDHVLFKNEDEYLNNQIPNIHIHWCFWMLNIGFDL